MVTVFKNMCKIDVILVGALLMSSAKLAEKNRRQRLSHNYVLTTFPFLHRHKHEDKKEEAPGGQLERLIVVCGTTRPSWAGSVEKRELWRKPGHRSNRMLELANCGRAQVGHGYLSVDDTEPGGSELEVLAERQELTFYSKLHCELNFIERDAKFYARPV